MRVARGSASWLSRNGRGLGPLDELGAPALPRTLQEGGAPARSSFSPRPSTASLRRSSMLTLQRRRLRRRLSCGSHTWGDKAGVCAGPTRGPAPANPLHPTKGGALSHPSAGGRAELQLLARAVHGFAQWLRAWTPRPAPALLSCAWVAPLDAGGPYSRGRGPRLMPIPGWAQSAHPLGRPPEQAARLWVP